MIAKNFRVFMSPLINDARRVNRHATTCHPESSGEAGSEGARSALCAFPSLIGATITFRRAVLKPRGASTTAPHLVILTLAAFFAASEGPKSGALSAFPCFPL
jgi:hypothetical protein